MKRIVLAALVIGSLMAGSARAVFADAGGVPNPNSCIGGEFSRFAGTSLVGPQVRTLAQNEFGPGIAAEVEAFRAATCP